MLDSSTDRPARYRGVHQLPSGRFKATIAVNAKSFGLGYFDDPKEAAMAVDNARQNLSRFFKIVPRKYNLHPSCSGGYEMPGTARVREWLEQNNAPTFRHYETTWNPDPEAVLSDLRKTVSLLNIELEILGKSIAAAKNLKKPGDTFPENEHLVMAA